MSSGTEGAAWRPQIEGYTGTGDEQAGVWVFVRDGDPSRVLRGRNLEELNAARAALVNDLVRDLLAYNHYAAQNGMTPPPSDYVPPHRA